MVRMPEERIPNYLLHWIPKHGKGPEAGPEKNWLSCVLEDAALFTGVDNISIEAAEQEASDRVQWRGLIRRNKEFLCGTGHSND